MIRMPLRRSAPKDVSVGTVLIFTLIGPVIAGAVTVSFFFVPAIFTPSKSIPPEQAMPLYATLFLVVMLSVIALFFSVIFGVLPALLVGTIVATWDRFFWQTGLWFPILLGALIGIGYAMLEPWQLVSHLWKGSGYLKAGVIVGSILSAVVCWRITAGGRVSA